ncbi:MAG: hypothetical protein KC621_15200 [Myxococcales bacterium]|nr:hypothetical protein [Myxococcales bacterium]
MIDPAAWKVARRVAARSFGTSFHFSVASLAADGSPRLTPVGSVMLSEEPGHLVFVELFAHGLAARLDADPRICLMGVDSGRLLWLSSLWRARFPSPPALRMWGQASPSSRPITPDEERRWLRRVGWLRRTRGGARLWGHPGPVRDVRVESLDGVGLAGMAPRIDRPHDATRRILRA